MWSKISNWLIKRYQRIVNSIAFYPALIAFSFLLLSYLMISFDFSDAGKHFKARLHWLSLRDATTARSIISSIVSGIISLTVFSFSMVMIILNQTASQMSNRILDKLIGNRFQQIVLGIYIGTIVFALFLLSTIRDIDSGISIPAISTYVLIAITIADIFLFIYFLHFITQSVKYEVIIYKIYKDTLTSMQQVCTEKQETITDTSEPTGDAITAGIAGIYDGFTKKTLLRICNNNHCTIRIMNMPGSFVWEDDELLSVSKTLPAEIIKEIQSTLEINNGEEIENNFLYGFRQLTEVAMKALSPGINDPGTAIQCLRALAKLFAFRLSHFPCTTVTNKENEVKIKFSQPTFEEIFCMNILPIWDYGKDDRMIQHEMLRMLTGIQKRTSVTAVDKLLEKVKWATRKNEL